jgi:hypothetical protein
MNGVRSEVLGPPAPGVVSDLDPMLVAGGFPFGWDYVNSLRAIATELSEVMLMPGFEPSAWSPFDFLSWEGEHARVIEWEAHAGGSCPWCGNRIYPSDPNCASCGAQIGSEFAFK